jgi:hypothetical protein
MCSEYANPNVTDVADTDNAYVMATPIAIAKWTADRVTIGLPAT